MKERSHEVLPHPSDVGLRIVGPDFASALAESVSALGRILAGGSVEPRDSVPVRVTGSSPEALVVAILEEALYLVDARGFLAGDARLVCGEGFVEGELVGEDYDPDRHDGVHVKAVTWHLLKIVEEDGVEITVYLDL